MALAVENHPQRSLIDEAFLANETLRAIQAKITPKVSVMALQRYRTQIILPAVNNAAMVAKLCKSKTLDSKPAIANLTKDVAEKLLQASPFRQRLESLWVRTEKAVTRAETAVRTITDRETGELCAAGPDVAAIAPLLNQAHKNLELLGQVTGELVPRSAAPADLTVQLMVMIPRATVQEVGPVIDVKAIEGPKK